MSNKQKLLIIAIIAVLTILGLVFLFIPKTQLTLAIAPSQANIQIDNGSTQRVSNGGKLSISPGSHTIIVSEDEFTRYQTTISIKKGETQELLVALVPNTDAARERLNNPTSQDIVQRFNGKTLSTQTDQLDKDYPILKDLPIEARLYRVYPCNSILHPGDATKIAVCVDSDIDVATIKPYVEQDLATRGYKVSDYEMIYTGDGSE
ncbi:MAG TPA: PEGA domain-containing protein [Candidatus Microsaccharimonas sp.]|jgi:hypothetical protein